MARNEEYWNSARGERTRFWQIIVRKINNIFGTQFTGEQVSIKWKNLRQDHVVSIFYVNYTGQKVQNQAPIRHQSVINQVPDWCLIGIFDKIRHQPGYLLFIDPVIRKRSIIARWIRLIKTSRTVAKPHF